MKPIIVENNYIPPSKNFLAVTLWPFIFVRKDVKKKNTTAYFKMLVNHEMIHIKQQTELLVIPFYFLYILLFILYGFKYRRNPFEAEAFANEYNKQYPNTRKRYSWIKYL
ncbi:MAG TPA: hypothetical protein PKE52_00225 [Bacteroidales bacterium]|nr:hypothetical protein [Bacteroidales bacterium]